MLQNATTIFHAWRFPMTERSPFHHSSLPTHRLLRLLRVLAGGLLFVPLISACSDGGSGGGGSGGLGGG